MISGLLGKKLGMTQVFMPDGSLIPCTVIEVGPCSVIQVKTQERDGYEAVQIGFLPKARGTNKPLTWTFHKAQRSTSPTPARIQSHRGDRLYCGRDFDGGDVRRG